MKRLPTHGRDQTPGDSCKYYLPDTGKRFVTLGLKLKNLYVIPELPVAPALSA
jgi:hypothetical protein